MLIFFLCIPSLLIPSPAAAEEVPKDFSGGARGSELALSVVEALGLLNLKERLIKALAGPARYLSARLRPALKLLGVAYVGYQTYDYVLPTLTGRDLPDEGDIGDGRTSGSQSLGDAIGELGISALVEKLRSWGVVTPDSGDLLDLWERQCKSRAACQLGRTLALRMPYLARVLGFFGTRLPVIHNFAEALQRGTGLPDCSLLYPDCPYIRAGGHSPGEQEELP